MNPKNRIALVVGTFCLTWGLTKHFFKQELTAAHPSSVRMASSGHVANGKPLPSRNSQKAIANSLANAPVDRWVGLWQEFADGSTEQDLQKIARFQQIPDSGNQATVSDFLRTMAEEELAVRGSTPILKSHAVAALAERDLEAAWQQVLEAKSTSVSSAFLRVLVASDPQDALAKVKALGHERDGGDSEERLGENGVYRTPLGSLISAWTRRNPAAAAAAAESQQEDMKNITRWEVALSMAYSNGPAGLSYFMQHCMQGSEEDSHRKISPLLRAAFSQSAASSRRVAEILTQHPSWTKTGDYSLYDALGPWHRTDPAGANAFYASIPPQIREIRQWAEHDAPAAMAAMEAADTKAIKAVFPYMTWLHEQFPERMEALAAQHGLTNEFQQRLAKHPLADHPKERVQKFMDRLSSEGLEKVVATFRLTGETEIDILEEMLDAARRFMPDAAATLESAISRVQKEGIKRKPQVTHQGRLSEQEFAYDPAAAALRLQDKGLKDWEAWDAVDYWAPYDFTGAHAWVQSLPDGPVRARAEIALLEHDSSISGEGLLTRILPLDPKDFKPKIYPEPSATLTQLWGMGLKRLAAEGGDWQAWLEKVPSSYLEDGVTRTQFNMFKDSLQKQWPGK